MLTYELLSEGNPLYLSYCAADVDFALPTAVDLKNAGVYLWMDRIDALSGSWTAALVQARARSDAVRRRRQVRGCERRRLRGRRALQPDAHVHSTRVRAAPSVGDELPRRREAPLRQVTARATW